LAVGKHRTSIAGGKAAWLGAEVKKDSIRFPAAKGANGHFVDAGDKEGGGAPRAEAVGFDAVRRNVGEMEDGGGGTAQFKRDIARGDIIGVIGQIIIAVERASWTRVVLTKVQSATTSGQHRAENRVP
jgi:hypothetical protein